MTIQVTKRDGSKEPYDTIKIKRSIAWACENWDVNPLELESKIDSFMKNGIKTSEIQANIIQHAVQLATPQSPDWLMVAGNAMSMDEWSSYKYLDKSFYDICKLMARKKELSSDIFQFYTEDQINELGNLIDNRRDLNHSISSLVTVKKKYLSKSETNQIMHMLNAMRFGQYEPESTRMSFVRDVYDVLSNREFSLATPFMSNIRKGGNVASCFILAIEDDLNSIFENVHRIAKISKNGGGLGIFMGFLRAKGSPVNGVDGASGTVVQWIKIINDTLVAVNQGGKRSGAGTVALPIWHNDIDDFLKMQTEHGDLRLKSFDVFPQLVVPDIFMERDREQGQWVTFCPYEVREKLGIDVRGLYGDKFKEAYLKIEEAAVAGKLKVCTIMKNARDLTKLAMRTQFETGLPYWCFIDTINKVNPNADDPEAYGILCANLCQESYSNVVPDKFAHVCNLGSINVGNISSIERIGEVSRIATRLLNRGISLTNNPDQITTDHNLRYQTIGIGIMGLHDYLAREHLSYKSLDVISEISECIEYNAVLESVDIAKEMGSFEAFEHSKWKSGEMTEMFASRGCGKYDWGYAQKQIDAHGIRNSQLTSPAPTTTTAIYQDASASILPVYSAFFSEDNKNGSLTVSAKFLKDNPLAYGKTQKKFSPMEIIDITATIQKFVDTGISMELVFDHTRPDFNAKSLYDAIHYAHISNIKTIYYIRNIKNNESIDVKEEEACVACAG